MKIVINLNNHSQRGFPSFTKFGRGKFELFSLQIY
jgi:hypothetical protein